MADDDQPLTVKRDEQNECISDTCDETLDMTSDKFDPLKALYASRVNLPAPAAKTLCSVAKYAAQMSRKMAAQQSGDGGSVQLQAGPSNVNARKEYATIQRRFLPHQEPIKSTRVFTEKNIFTWMNKIEGPMKLLKDCMDKKLRIKAVTRNDRGVRGHCVGFVMAFDKHWNLALEDVTEVWTRRRYPKVPALGQESTIINEKREFRAPSGRLVQLPRIVVKNVQKKVEECERYLPKLLIKGEHIVMVSVFDK